MNERQEEFYCAVIDSENIPNSIPRERLSKNYLSQMKAHVRLGYEINILEKFDIIEALKQCGKNALMMSHEETFHCELFSLDFEQFVEKVDVFEKTRSVIVSDETLTNFLVLMNDQDAIWMVGEENFLKRAQPYPLEIMSHYYFCVYGDPESPNDTDHPDSEEFWILWNDYKSFLLK